MSSEELDHLYELLSIHSERLKELEKIEARYGVDTQAHILTEIKSLRRKLHSLKNTINAIEQPTFEQEVLYQEVEYEPTYNSSLDEFINSLPFSRKTLFIIVGTIIAATILYLFASSGPILTDDFSVNAGLGSWRTNGSVTLTLDNSTQIPIEAQESGTPQPTELPKDTVQLQGSNSYLFKILDDKTSN